MKVNGSIERICLQCDELFYVFPYQLKRGHGKFCSRSCAMTYKNIHNNPTQDEKVRRKISTNHADVSGVNNPMYGRTKETAPSYIDGRSKYKGETYKKMLLANVEHKCKICGENNLKKLHAHHKDGNHSNNVLDNLVLLCNKCHNTIAHKYIRNEKGQFTKIILNEVII